MTSVKTKGLVLREYAAGESDKRITILCKGHGRLVTYARGARKAKSKFLALSQMLTYGDYILADGGNFLSLAQGQIIENFYPIRQDYISLCHAQYVLEICDKTIPERTPCDELLRLALKALQHISKQIIAPRQAVCVFLFRFFLFCGLEPEMSCCCLCGEAANNFTVFCDEGMICCDCYKGKDTFYSKMSTPLSSVAQKTIRHILSADINVAFMFRVQDTVLDELALAGQLYWKRHFAATLKIDVIGI